VGSIPTWPTKEKTTPLRAVFPCGGFWGLSDSPWPSAMPLPHHKRRPDIAGSIAPHCIRTTHSSVEWCRIAQQHLEASARRAGPVRCRRDTPAFPIDHIMCPTLPTCWPVAINCHMTRPSPCSLESRSSGASRYICDRGKTCKKQSRCYDECG
jgi:hypothetical protein